MNPFDFVTSITYSKQDIMNEINEKEYNLIKQKSKNNLNYINELND